MRQNSFCAHLKKIENFFSAFTTPNTLLSLILKMPGNKPFVRSEYVLITPSLTLLYLPCCASIFLRTYPAGLLPRFFFALTPYPALTLLCPYFSSRRSRLLRKCAQKKNF